MLVLEGARGDISFATADQRDHVRAQYQNRSLANFGDVNKRIKAWNGDELTKWFTTSHLMLCLRRRLFTWAKTRSRVSFFEHCAGISLTAADEDLIKYGLEEDVWFHADKLSSAHIYLRMNEGESWENIPEDLVVDCAQLTKANSIEGNVHVISPWPSVTEFLSR